MGTVIDIRYCKDIFLQILAAIQELDVNTDQIESQLTTIITELNTLNSVDFATEATLNTKLQSIIDNTVGILNQLIVLNTNTDEVELKLDDVILQLTSLNAFDFATETTLSGIKNQTDQLTFTSGNLNVNATFTGESRFGDTSSVTTVVSSLTSINLSVANTDRKEVFILNNSNKKMWIAYGPIAALVGNGIPLNKDEILIEDVFRGDINAIWESGAIGTAEITEVFV